MAVEGLEVCPLLPGQDIGGDTVIIVQQVAFCISLFRPEYLAEVGEGQIVAVDVPRLGFVGGIEEGLAA